ncbi:hypothetical protein NA57DRAFT_68971 [Rhizodiscina lignyota]|uniref:Uncharacterized protein n=1 Tax=Rhizodiscina lignyota TaxID=1504668 RepID=A0A9P4M1Y9_9PEZI|nr:hypothetical protein NA57DRAFT_68971 [Rhizodiscina lignyota]
MNEKATPDRILSSSQDKKLVGWVLESPGRGTLSLITTCLFTTFLCTWAIIHPRVTRSPSRRISHKFAVFVKTILAPEFLAVEGLQEWSQARKIVQQCGHLTDGELDLVRAFYIGMLALRYRAEQGQKVIWPNQYQWLLEQHLVDWKDHESWGLSRENIRDKSNADTTVKLFAFVQVSWFVAQSIMRAVHDLPVSQLESMTLSYVPMFVVTYFFWWAKPKDVLTPSVVELPNMSLEQKVTFENMSVDSTFDDEHTKQQDSWWNVWKLTPRTFEKEARDKAFEEMSHNTLSNYPSETVLAYWDPQVYHSKIWPITCLFGASFGALHLISWHTVFPTLVETWLWRVAAITSIVSMLIFMQFDKVVLRWGGPLTILSIVSPGVYLLSRIVMIGGVIAAFRGMDPIIYETYVVSTYWVHLV